MTLHKNQERGKCFLKLALYPFLAPMIEVWSKAIPAGVVFCDPECVLYRRGIRYNEQTKGNFPFEECAINIIADNIEMVHLRQFGLQKEMGEVKNATLFQALATLADNNPESEYQHILATLIAKAGGPQGVMEKLLLPKGNQNERPEKP